MHKKLESDLMSLAHSVLQMKNKENVFLLKQKAHEIYEKLAVLAFVEEYVNSTPGLQETKEELIAKVEKGYTVKDLISGEAIVEKKAIVDQTTKEDSLEVDNEKLVAEIGGGISEKEIGIKEAEEKIEEELGAHLEMEEVAEIEQHFDALEGLIFGDTKSATLKDDTKVDGERRG